MVYLKTACVCLTLCLASLAVWRVLMPYMHDTALPQAAALVLVQATTIVMIAIYLLVRRACTSYRDGIYEQIRPAIQERVMALAFSGEAWATTIPKRWPSRAVLEECVARALTGLKDSSRNRMACFARDQGFGRQWAKTFSSGSREQRRRAISLLGAVAEGLAASSAESIAIESALFERDAAIRTGAARALLTIGDAEKVDWVFRSTLRESMLVRALLIGDLKRHARHLLAGTVPSILAGDSPADIRSCLEILAVWKVAAPNINILSLLDKHLDPRVISLVLELLPYTQVNDSLEGRLSLMIKGANSEMQCAAARACGRMKLSRLSPALVEALHQNRNFALSAASALAQLGAEGKLQLENIIRGNDRGAAAVAMEALEVLAVGR